MEIKIKKIGAAKGTVGWLADGLTNGSLSIVEGKMKVIGHHGLWLKGPDGFGQFLGGFNQYGLDAIDGNYNKYDQADDSDRLGLWTDAAWETLMNLSEKWCDEMNKLIEEEEPITLKFVRIEKEN